MSHALDGWTFRETTVDGPYQFQGAGIKLGCYFSLGAVNVKSVPPSPLS